MSRPLWARKGCHPITPSVALGTLSTSLMVSLGGLNGPILLSPGNLHEGGGWSTLHVLSFDAH